MTGQDVIDYIRENHLEGAVVIVTATKYYDGDHDCTSTDDVSLSTGGWYDSKAGKSHPSLDFYVDNHLEY